MITISIGNVQLISILDSMESQGCCPGSLRFLKQSISNSLCYLILASINLLKPLPMLLSLLQPTVSFKFISPKLRPTLYDISFKSLFSGFKKRTEIHVHSNSAPQNVVKLSIFYQPSSFHSEAQSVQSIIIKNKLFPCNL